MSVKRSSATHLILRIAPQLSCSRNPLNIRNSLIYYANRYFHISSVSQVQKPYCASTNEYNLKNKQPIPAKEAAPVRCLQRGQGNFELVTNSDYNSRGSADPREKSA